MKYLALLTAILLAGCDSNDNYEISNTDFKLHVRLLDSVQYGNAVVSGKATWRNDGSECWIELPKAEYPRCLSHELRHCIEGDFHAGHTSYEDCTE